MEIPPALGALMTINNYFHDFATALLVSSGVALWFIMRKYNAHPRREDRTVTEYFLGLYKSMTKVAKFSLFWIFIGGVPRTLFYRDLEWVTAVKQGQVPALIVKHMLTFAFVGTGIHLWVRLRKKVRDVEETMTPRQA